MDNISLGIHIGMNGGVAAIRNGILIGAVKTKHVVDIKQTNINDIPYEVIDQLLKYLNINIQNIHTIGISHTSVEIANLETFYTKELQTHYNIDDFTLIPVNHHRSHAETAYSTSNFAESLILVADLGGDYIHDKEESETLYVGKNNDIYLLEQRLQSQAFDSISKIQNHCYPFLNKTTLNEQVSLVKKFQQIIQLLGITMNDYRTIIESPINKEQIYNYEKKYIHNLKFNLTVSEFLEEIYKQFLTSKLPYHKYLLIEKEKIVHTVQDFLENIVVDLINVITKTYDMKNLCLTGDLFLNTKLTQKILQTFDTININICPSCGDEGQSIGNAYYAYKYLNKKIYQTVKLPPYLGLSYSNKQIISAIKSNNLSYILYDENKLSKIIAKKLCENKLIGFFSGRGDIISYPQCNRCVLVNPTWNGILKQNFDFMESIVIKEFQTNVFEVEEDISYMSYTAKIKDKYKKLLKPYLKSFKSIIHSITKSVNPLLYNIVFEFGTITDIPVLICVPFHNFNESCIDTPENAIKTFVDSDMDFLVIENFIICKN